MLQFSFSKEYIAYYESKEGSYCFTLKVHSDN